MRPMIDAARPLQAPVESVAACPSCRVALVWGDSMVTCPSCETRYERRNGVPLLFAPGDELSVGPTDDPGALATLPPAAQRILGRFPRLKPTLTYKSPRTTGLVHAFVRACPAESVILNVGAGATRYAQNVIGMDIDTFAGVDLVGVAERLPVADGSCDAVVLQAVLEHVRRADRTLAEIHRVLRPGGELFVEVPFIQGYHPSPGDYRRYTEDGLRAECVDFGFEPSASGVVPGPASAAAWTFAEYLALLMSGRSAKAYRRARPLARLIASPVKYADFWLDSHPMARTIASGFWVQARRVENGRRLRSVS